VTRLATTAIQAGGIAVVVFLVRLIVADIRDQPKGE